jgi:hypothetical protein
VTTVQAGLSVSDPQAYREKLFTLLGDRNPLEVLAQTASTLAEIVRTHSATVLRTRTFEGKWTPNEVIGHLADGEWVFGFSTEADSLLGQSDHPGHEPGFVLVAARRHNEREPSALVELFRTMRQFNLALSKPMSPADLKRTCQHNERGPESLAVMLRMLACHDLAHLDQITRNIRAVRRE